MTRAEKVKEYIFNRYGVKINEDTLWQTEFRFQECDGFECPAECMHEEEAPDCDKCRYYNFWEQEDDDVLSNF